MASHPDRVRANYRCPQCDGEGQIVEPYEGSWPCSLCGGSGILLTPPPPPSQGRSLSPLDQIVVKASLEQLERTLASTRLVTREADTPTRVGDTIRVRVPGEYR